MSCACTGRTCTGRIEAKLSIYTELSCERGVVIVGVMCMSVLFQTTHTHPHNAHLPLALCMRAMEGWEYVECEAGCGCACCYALRWSASHNCSQHTHSHTHTQRQPTLSLEEGEDHAAANDDLVALLDKGLEDGDLGGDLCVLRRARACVCCVQA